MATLSLTAFLCVSRISSAQTTSQKTNPAQDRRVDDHRLDDALSDLALLKRVVKEQDSRIANLEKAVRALQPAPPKTLPSKIPWQTPVTWERVKAGMSRVNVEEVLGPSTTVDSVIDSVTLTYKGDAPGGGALMGTVKLTDDRVVQVTPPQF